MRLDTSEGAPPVKEQLKDALQKNLARVMDLFRELDVDSNGMVSIMEFRQALPLLFGPDGCPEEVADELFVSFDEDGGTSNAGLVYNQHFFEYPCMRTITKAVYYFD